MQDERKQVLEMLATGKISAEDAERLLDRLTPTAPPGPSSPSGANDNAPLKFMRVHVDSHEGDQVDVRLPINLLRSGIKLSAMIPKEAVEAMSNNGVDFSQLTSLSGDEFMNVMRNLTIDVASHEGDQVRIFCE